MSCGVDVEVLLLGMLGEIWHNGLYQPLLNALFFIYENFAGENMGIAVIELTLAVRIILLPLSLISEHKTGILESLSRKLEGVIHDFKSDPIHQREEIRKILKSHHVNPWAKVVTLGVQVLVLILLYQVFMGGLGTQKLDDLYSFVRRPDFVNTTFLGFNVAARNLYWALAVGVLLFIEIAVEQHARRNILKQRDLFYRYAFPIVSVIILSRLPMTKSLFILTSMGFSVILFGIRKGMSEKYADE